MAQGREGKLTIRPLTPAHVDDLKTVTAGTWGATCWCLFPRYTGAQQRERGLTDNAARRAEVARLARRRNAPGLIAYRGSEPVGWVAIAPRTDLSAIDRSRATPALDELAVWVIPCITVRHGNRGRGIAVRMIRAAVEYAGKFGAPAVEAYPRAKNQRLHDDFVFYGTEAMFRKAGFREVRGVLEGLPKTWTPRVTMRRTLRKRGAPRARPAASGARQTATARTRRIERPQRSRRTGGSGSAPRTGAREGRRATAR
jgi:GNAT superfamily N-acetyltransferase